MDCQKLKLINLGARLKKDALIIKIQATNFMAEKAYYCSIFG